MPELRSETLEEGMARHLKVLAENEAQASKIGRRLKPRERLNFEFRQEACPHCGAIGAVIYSINHRIHPETGATVSDSLVNKILCRCQMSEAARRRDDERAAQAEYDSWAERCRQIEDDYREKRERSEQEQLTEKQSRCKAAMEAAGRCIQTDQSQPECQGCSKASKRWKRTEKPSTARKPPLREVPMEEVAW